MIEQLNGEIESIKSQQCEASNRLESEVAQLKSANEEMANQIESLNSQLNSNNEVNANFKVFFKIKSKFYHIRALLK